MREKLPTISLGGLYRQEELPLSQLPVPLVLAWLLNLAVGGADDRNTSALRLIRALVLEGKRYAETEPGKEWMGRLQNSRAIVNCNMIWNLVNVEVHLAGTRPMSREAKQMFEATLNEIASEDLTQFLLNLSRMSLDQDLRAAREMQHA